MQGLAWLGFAAGVARGSCGFHAMRVAPAVDNSRMGLRTGLSVPGAPLHMPG